MASCAQVSSVVFRIPVLWPPEWLAVVRAFVSLFSFEFLFQLVFPPGMSPVLELVVLVFLPFLLFWISTRLWLDAHAWKLAYVENWDQTQEDMVFRLLWLNLVAFSFCTVMVEIEYTEGNTFYGVC